MSGTAGDTVMAARPSRPAVTIIGVSTYDGHRVRNEIPQSSSARSTDALKMSDENVCKWVLTETCSRISKFLTKLDWCLTNGWGGRHRERCDDLDYFKGNLKKRTHANETHI